MKKNEKLWKSNHCFKLTIPIICLMLPLKTENFQKIMKKVILIMVKNYTQYLIQIAINK